MIFRPFLPRLAHISLSSRCLLMKRKLGSLSESEHLAAQASTTKRKMTTGSTSEESQPQQQQRTAATKMLPDLKSATIELDEKESKLRELLVAVADSINESKQANNEKEKVELRWAGGWVRDKLLGIQSHDIDTAINCMTGEAFATRLTAFCDVEANRARYGVGPDDVGRLHKVASNPDKSKHLETTTTKLYGLDLDFVNLRKETYADDSRNPQVEFGTPQEDAERRDATVNALFYNIHTQLVEDFTGGLEDMRRGLIRTPMEPFQTFMDDPLRVLRLLRFASRLEFKIDAEAERVMSDPRVLDALRLKISRERIGVELEKMLKGRHPCESLRLIDRLGLYHAVFTDPARQNMPRPDLADWSTAYECLDDLRSKSKTPGSIYDALVTSEEAAYFAWNLAALTPWEQLPEDPPLKNNKPAPPLATQAAREGFKAPNHLTKVITPAHVNRPEILKLRDVVCKGDPDMNKRDVFGMAIRKWDGADRGGHWRLQVLFAALVDVAERTGPKSTADRGGKEENREDVLAEWKKFLDHLAELDLIEVSSLKPLVDGKTLAKELGVKPGPWMMKALNICLSWQLRNPGVTDIAGAVEEVKAKREELGIR